MFRHLRVCFAPMLLTILPLLALMPHANALEGSYASLRAAVEHLTQRHGTAYPEGAAWLARLEELERNGVSTDDPAFTALHRKALLSNPLVNNAPILFVTRRQYKPDHHNTETMFQTGEINTASFEGGGAMKTLDLAQGGVVTTLLETPDGVIRDPDVHFDGDRILFSMRRDIADDYSLYELALDTGLVRALTATPRVSDINPIYLPDGDIIFSSSREPKFCMCNRHIMCNLFRMSGDGANIHQIGKSTLFEGHPRLLSDGRLLYDRWEYVDRNFGDAQGLWTTHPDGTNHAVYWGNNTQSPGAVIDARPIPGSQRVICVFSSCHDRPWGALAIIDRRLGVNGVHHGERSPSVIRTWPETAIDLVGEGDFERFNWDTFMQVTPKYEDPYPLDDAFFLAVRTLGIGEVTGIVLLDLFGNELLLHAEGDDPSALGCYNPVPLAPRSKPPILPDRRDLSADSGVFVVADVYQGPYMAGVERSAATHLRVVETPEKRSFTGPAWEGQGQQAPAMNWHDFTSKRILGEVPIEPDGSAHFTVPADTFVYFQLLDGQGKMIQSMRSGAMIQPGETQGCMGCHEERRTAPTLADAPRLKALERAPDDLTGWHGPPRTFCYMREVQPVFDAHCVRCHDYGQPAGAVLNLAGDRDVVFNTSYNELWRKGYIAAIGGGPAQTQYAYSWGAHASRLLSALEDDNHDEVDLDAEALNRIITWIDINAPYYPEYESAYPEGLAGRSPLSQAQQHGLARLTGIDFGAMMGHAVNKGPLLSFERPEQSPALQVLRESDPAAFEQALDIVRKGAESLVRRPRADMEGFIPEAEHRARLRQYRARQNAERRIRSAIRTGEAIYDLGLPE